MSGSLEVTRIPFVVPRSRNSLAFKHYDADQVVEGKIGAEIEMGKHSLISLEKIALSTPDPVASHSGRQELIENIINKLL